MTIREIQEYAAETLSACAAFRRAGVRAIPEDTREVLFEAARALEGAGVCVVVATPRAERSGSGHAGIPVEMTLRVLCTERPEVNRAEPGRPTALGLAEAAAHALDGPGVELARLEQTAAGGTVTAAAEFALCVTLTAAD